MAQAIAKVAKHFGAPRSDGDRLGIIGFCGAPFTLASYMIEGGSSRSYVETKQMMYRSAQRGLERGGGREASAWPLLMEKLINVLAAYAGQQVEAGADCIQIFDSWAGALSVSDYREFVLGPTSADVSGLDWRVPLDVGWRAVGAGCAVQGNLDPITLFAPETVIEARVREILALANGRPGHIFNLGHGIVPGTPVESVLRVVELVKRYGESSPGPRARDEAADDWAVRA